MLSISQERTARALAELHAGEAFVILLSRLSEVGFVSLKLTENGDLSH